MLYSVTPQEQVADHARAIREPSLNSEQAGRYLSPLGQGWGLEGNIGPQIVFTKEHGGQEPNSKIFPIVGKICVIEGTGLRVADDRISVVFQGNSILPEYIARVALVDFAYAHRDPIPDLVTLSKIVGPVNTREIPYIQHRSRADSEESPTLPVPGQLYSEHGLEKLSKREHEILAISHMSNTVIAENTDSAESTIRTYMSLIAQKLNCPNIALASIAHDRGLFELPQELQDHIDCINISDISERTEVVLSLWGDGYSYDQIGGHLHISPATVRTHIHKCYETLGGKHGRENHLIAHILGLI